MATMHNIILFVSFLMTYMYQLMIHTCSHVPVYCVYQNTHTPLLLFSLFFSPLRNIAPFLSILQL